VPVYAGFTPAETRRALRQKIEPSYMGTFTSAKRYVLHTFANSQSAMMKNRVARYMLSKPCYSCHGKRLRADALDVKVGGLDIAEVAAMPLKRMHGLFRGFLSPSRSKDRNVEKETVRERIARDVVARLAVLEDLGLGYLSMDRSTPTLSPGELQRLRLATQLHSNLFGVVYVLDEPSAGLHPHDTEALLRALDALKESGNSLFVVEHELDVIRHADWLVDVGPGAGGEGGEVLYSGPPDGLRNVKESETRRYLFAQRTMQPRQPRAARDWLQLKGVHLHNLKGLDVSIPLGVLTTVTGVSGSGKSTLVSHAVVDLVAEHLGQSIESIDDEDSATDTKPATGYIANGLSGIRRLIRVDQKPIGRTPRSNMATYTGVFDHIRQLFANTKMAKQRKYDAGRFSFNVAKGRCDRCAGEGFICVELLFLPSVYSPCPVCNGSRFNPKKLEVTYRGKNIAEVLKMTVSAAIEFFQEDPQALKTLVVLREVGLGYLRLGQPATELSGGEAQRIKLATELQRAGRGDALYVLDEPTTGLHPLDVERLLVQLQLLVDAGNTVVVVEHDMDIIAASDWIIDIGPGPGEEGGRLVATGTPRQVSAAKNSKTAPYLASKLGL